MISMITDPENNTPLSNPTQLSLFPAASETAPPIDHDDANSLLALARIGGVGFGTARVLFEAYRGRLSAVWDARPEELLEHLRMARSPQPHAILEAIQNQAKRYLSWGREHYAFLQKSNVTYVPRGSALYPSSLMDLPDPPAWLFVEGNVQLLHDPAIVAVVGTREPTPNGIVAARKLSIRLAAGRSVILSGLAEGIDEVGHQTAVDYGSPTIAVLGHGIEVIFPRSTAGLRRQIVERGGAVVSEYLPHDNYARERFVQRNRIQAALSLLVAVVEGRSKSGTAHTVRFARRLERPIFGVRMGPPATLPQHELLAEIEQNDDFVFDLSDETQLRQLNNFLRAMIPPELRQHRNGTPRVFNGLLPEIDRLMQAYPVGETDLDWLIDELDRIRNTLFKDTP